MAAKASKKFAVTAMLVAAAIAGSLIDADGADAADRKKIVLNGKFGQTISKTAAAPGAIDGHEMAQQVRVDNLASSDPDWNGSTITLYEQTESLPASGTYRIVGVVTLKSGDKAYMEFGGKWDVVKSGDQFVEAPFEAKGKLVGGTGKLANLSGTVVQKGKVTPAEGGKYSITADASY